MLMLFYVILDLEDILIVISQLINNLIQLESMEHICHSDNR